MDRRYHDPLGSRASSCYSSSWSDHDVEMQHHPQLQAVASDEDWDEGDTFISFTTTETKCEELFEEGLQYKLKGELDQAVPCFLKCLEGMQECQYFAKLPQTLHVLAELYQSLNCYDKAVEFAQAEKLFYEAVILDSTTSGGERKTKPKRKPFSKKPKDQSWRRGSNPAEYGDLLVKKADEYNQLAKLCGEQKKYDLALDYCGKAAKIRKSVFGDSHRITKETLDYLTVLYAEVGRAEYMNALQRARCAEESKDQRRSPSHLEAAEPLTSEGDKCTQTDSCCHEKAGISVSVLNTCTEASATNGSSNDPTVGTNVRTNGQMAACECTNSVSTVDEAMSNTVEEEERNHDSSLPLTACERSGPSTYQGWKEASHTQDTRQEVCSHNMSSRSDSREDQNSPHHPGSINGCHQEINGMQVNKFDLSDTDSNDKEGSWHSCNLKESFESSNEALHGTSPPPLPHKKQEYCFVEPVGAHKKAAVITDVLSKAPACVYVAVPEQGIEHARCLPLWVLVLGAFVEMAILAYVFLTHR